MTETKLLVQFQKDLCRYSDEHLKTIPSPGVWSVGQMYDHLIVVAHEYLDNLETCARSAEDQPLGKTEYGERLFKDGGFPPVKIRLPDELNAPPDNSGSRADLNARMEELIRRMARWETELDAIDPHTKVRHGGFGWLNAEEWLKLVEMHFRHHLRQKNELDSYIF
ncbi:DinB family protein [Planococcus sp. FY231025]|uniref:DinB family protein n=1 Tax=Planococcus sp. FY231025 TaxID=3455699 RepID=UPI003F910D39